MSRDLQASRWLITGASGGIGRALAEKLLQRGARVLVMARRGQVLLDWQAKLGETASQTLCFAGDVTQATDRAAVLRLVEQEWGGIDGLINNAGTGALGKFSEQDPSLIRKIMEVNFFAPVELTRAALPLLQSGRQPLLVNIGSILGHRATPGNHEYCASKFALRGWSESIRPELLKLGIDMLLVSPGTTESEFYANNLSEQKVPAWGNPPAIPAADVAAQIVRAIERGSRHIIPSWRGKLLVWANRWFPSIVDRVMNRWG